MERKRRRNNNYRLDYMCESATMMSTGDKRYVLSTWDRFALLIALVLFASICNTCQSFNPSIDSRPNNSRHQNQLTKLQVVETEAPTYRTPVVPGQFPGQPDLFGSVYSSNQIICEGHGNTSSNDSDREEEVSESSQQGNSISDDQDDAYEEGGGDESEEDRARRLARTKMAANLLSRRGGTTQTSNSVRQKTTSVGARRIGSATRARGKDSSLTKLVDAVRKGAGANAIPSKPTDKPSSPGGGRETNNNNNNNNEMTSGLMLTASAIHNSVQEMMGVFGNPASTAQASTITVLPQHHPTPQHPAPGTILLSPGQQTKPWNPADRVSVRVAAASDDADIASLRLSVFSTFSSEMRKAFVSRSCHVLATRRNRGATCIAATVPRYGSILSQKPDIILGSAECSFHEFHGTTLGRRRLQDSILYVTEVAVSPTSRRKGIGFKIMQAIDQLATIRGAESLFLHVDVTNSVALSLYERCGYNRVAQEDIFLEFTRSLNLHDGATKGRNHFLLYKDLRPPTWLPSENESMWGVQRNSLGFEIPC